MTAFVTTADELTLVLRQTTERLQIKLTGAAGVLVDATVLTFELRTLGERVIVRDTFGAPGSRIVRKSLGVYYYPLGDQTVVTNRETACSGDFLGVWHIEADDDADNVVQTVKIVSAYVFELVGRLRRQIDKAAMLVVDDPENPCFLGYTDKALVEYLESGLTIINAYQPYPTFCGLGEFPRVYLQVLIDAALVVGVMSQELFAVASDVPNYSAQGAALVIQHQPQLAQFAARVSQLLDKRIPQMKLHLVNSGSIHTEMSPNYRLQIMLDMAPPGATFRNLFTAGG